MPLLRGVAGGVVGQQPAGVPDQAEHQRVLADEVAARRRDVERQAGPEPGQRAGQRPAGQRQRSHREQYQVGAGATGERDPIDDGQLDDDRDGDYRDGDKPAHVSLRPWQTRSAEAAGVAAELAAD